MSVNARGRKNRFFRSLLGQSSGLLLWMSVVLHSAIALFPLKEAPASPKQAALESPVAMTVTRLPKISPVAVPENIDSQPIAPQPIAPQPMAPQSIAPQPTISQPVIPQPVIPQPVEPKPAPLPGMAEPSSNMAVENVPVENAPIENTATENEESGQPWPQSNEEASNEAKVAAMAAAWDSFLGSFQSGLSEFSLQEILNFFGQPGQEDLFFDANQQPKISVVSYHLLEDKTPEQVFEQSVEPRLNEQEGFEVRVYGEFAGGPVYEVVQGEIVHYLNIVPLNERSGSVLIVCDRPPDA